jgi:hypothetical protein
MKVRRIVLKQLQFVKITGFWVMVLCRSRIGKPLLQRDCHPKDGGSSFLRNDVTLLPDDMAPLL